MFQVTVSPFLTDLLETILITSKSANGTGSTVQLTFVKVPSRVMIVRLFVRLPKALTLTNTVITAGSSALILVITQKIFCSWTVSFISTSAPVILTVLMNSKPSGKLSSTINGLP